MSRTIFPALALAALAATAGVAQAQQPQGQSMEERLRAQLRTTTTQLQQAQNELAALKAGQPAGKAPGVAPPASELETLKKELAASQAQLTPEGHARGQGSAGNE